MDLLLMSKVTSFIYFAQEIETNKMIYPEIL
jgi:hypothetical protein